MTEICFVHNGLFLPGMPTWQIVANPTDCTIRRCFIHSSHEQLPCGGGDLGGSVVLTDTPIYPPSLIEVPEDYDHPLQYDSRSLF